MAFRHLFEHRRSIAALGKLALSPRGYRTTASLGVPGPVYSEVTGAPPSWLVGEYIELVGGRSAAYKESLPPHLFPGWAFPTMALALEASGAPLVRVVNAGCRLRVDAPISRFEPLSTQAQLVRVEDKDGAVILTTSVSTGNAERPPGVRAELTALIPRARGKGKKGGGAKRTPALVPSDAELVTRFDFTPDTARAFANLTGDFNPIHWLRPYARLMGFKRTILHGFGSLAWCYEALARVLATDGKSLRELDARFTRPLLLPASPALFITKSGALALGDAPGEPAYLEGAFVAEGSAPPGGNGS